MFNSIILLNFLNYSEKLGLSERERIEELVQRDSLSLGPVLEKLDKSGINSNLNRNYLERKQTVGKLYNIDGNIL